LLPHTKSVGWMAEAIHTGSTEPVQARSRLAWKSLRAFSTLQALRSPQCLPFVATSSTGLIVTDVNQAREEMRPKVALGQFELGRIIHLNEIQPVRMRGDPPRTPHSRFQHFLRPLYRPLAGADGHQHTGEVSNHVMQEGIGAHIDDDESSMLEQLQVMNGLDR